MNQANIPLFKLAQRNQLPKLQLMDLETVERIKSHIRLKPQTIHEVFSDYKAISQEEIIEFIPVKQYFAKPNHFRSIHGISHIVRVMINSLVLCQLIQCPYIEVLIAAALHDIRRQNDKGDKDHGKRSANWFRRNYRSIPFTKDLKSSEIKTVEMIISYHDAPIKSIPVSCKNRGLINILRAADALDRYRLPKIKWWPKPSYLFIKEAKKLFNLSKIFVYQSELACLKNNIPKERSVIEVAKEIGYIKK